MGDKTVSYCMFCPPPPPCSLWMILAAHFAFLFLKKKILLATCDASPTPVIHAIKKHRLKQSVFYHNLTNDIKSWNSYCFFFGNISHWVFYPLQSFYFLAPLLDSFLKVYLHCETIKQCIYQTCISGQTL